MSDQKTEKHDLQLTLAGSQELDPDSWMKDFSSSDEDSPEKERKAALPSPLSSLPSPASLSSAESTPKKPLHTSASEGDVRGRGRGSARKISFNLSKSFGSLPSERPSDNKNINPEEASLKQAIAWIKVGAYVNHNAKAHLSIVEKLFKRFGGKKDFLVAAFGNEVILKHHAAWVIEKVNEMKDEMKRLVDKNEKIQYCGDVAIILAKLQKNPYQEGKLDNMKLAITQALEIEKSHVADLFKQFDKEVSFLRAAFCNEGIVQHHGELVVKAIKSVMRCTKKYTEAGDETGIEYCESVKALLEILKTNKCYQSNEHKELRGVVRKALEKIKTKLDVLEPKTYPAAPPLESKLILPVVAPPLKAESIVVPRERESQMCTISSSRAAQDVKDEGLSVNYDRAISAIRNQSSFSVAGAIGSFFVGQRISQLPSDLEQRPVSNNDMVIRMVGG